MFKRIGALAKVLRNPEILTKVMSGGGADYASPSAWQLSTYGPSMPIQPITRPRDVEIPRTIDYPIAINSMLTPRTGYSNGGIPLRPFGDMATAYESVSECRAPVSLIQRELSAFRPRLVDKNGNEVMGHPYQWMCELPDGETPFSVWLSRFVKSTKVYDAPALYFDRDSSGKIKGLHYIDGSTLFAIVNEFGKTPKPTLIQEYLLNVSQNGVAQPSLTVPDSVLGPSSVAEFINQYNNRLRDGNDVPLKVPAYTQVIKGSPYAWWSSDDIWYQPQSIRTNAPYGESFIEACWTWIMIVANIQSFELAHYRTGNMPEGYFTVSKEFFATTDEVMNAEDVFNARMTSNPLTERNRVRVFPDGTKFEATKKADFPEKLYTQANKNIWHSIGIPPAEFGDTPGGGLGGAGFKKGSSDELSRNTLNPHRIFVGIPFNEVLRRDGVTDVTFVLDYPVVQIDVDKLNQSVYDGMTHGILSLNDGLGRLGLSPVGDPNDRENIANKHLILGGGVVFVIEDMDVQNGIAMPSFGGKDKTGGEPVGPETVAKMNGLEHTPEDIQTLMRVIKNVQEYGTLDSKTYSISNGKKFEKIDATRSGSAMIAVMIPKEVSYQLRQITESIGFPKDAVLETPENMHVTLAYLPNIEEIIERQEGILSIISSVTQQFDSLVGRIQGYGVFNQQDGDKVLFALLDESQLPFIRSKLCEMLDASGVVYSKDYGFVPHITMAYFPASFKLPEGFTIPDIPIMIPGITLVVDNEQSPLLFGKQLTKHCGVCEEDDEYFGSPISHEIPLTFPKDHHANGVDIAAAVPEGLTPKPVLWKPEGQETPNLVRYIGGPQYLREEAAYLLDRSLGFYLVPVAWVSESNGEHGAAIWYTPGLQHGYSDLSKYDPEWVEKAGVFDYIISQADRGVSHNYGTHPDNDKRMILYDNGLSFPENESIYCHSVFCKAMLNKPLSVIPTLKRVLYDKAVWSDIQRLVGQQATDKAIVCLRRLIDEGMITPYEHEHASS